MYVYVCMYIYIYIYSTVDGSRLPCMDPENPCIIPIPRPQAKALPITCMTTATAGTHSLFRYLIMVTNNGVSGTIMAVLGQDTRVANEDAQCNHTNTKTCPLMALAAGSGGPLSSRAMKCSLTIVSSTKRVNQGGDVFIYQSDNRFRVPFGSLGDESNTLTNKGLGAVIDTILAQKDRRAINGADLQVPKKFVNRVVDSVDYENFKPYQGTNTTSQFLNHVSTIEGSSSTTLIALENDRPMNTMCIVLDTLPDNDANTYRLTARATWMTRWSLDSVPGLLQAEIPVASKTKIAGMQR